MSRKTIMAGAAVQNVGVVESTPKTKAAQAPPKPDSERGEAFDKALEDARRREVKGQEKPPAKAVAKKGRGREAAATKPGAESESAGAVEKKPRDKGESVAVQAGSEGEPDQPAKADGEDVKAPVAGESPQ